jgi:predicted RNA-binding protein with PIN domain
MSFHFLVDGYNLLYALEELPSGSLQQKREKLLSLLKQRRPQGKNKLTVVFDSRQGLGNQTQDNDITVVFTAGETADDWIGGKVRKTHQPRSLVVVSNDQGIRLDIRGTGARFISVENFLKGTPAENCPKPPGPRSHPAAEEITEEFRKKWL